MQTIATVDLGTNAMRLAIASGSYEKYDLVHYIRYPNRLSDGMYADSMLKQPAIDRTINALEEIRTLIDKYDVTRIRLISTSVLRTAKNNNDFLKLVKQKTGFDIEIIHGDEEARLIHTGAVNGIDTGGKKALVVDIGGGSTELSIGDRKHIEIAVAIETGAVRLKEQFIKHDPPSRGELLEIEKTVKNNFSTILKKITSAEPEIRIGVPGNIGTIYNILKPQDGLTLTMLEGFYGKLSLLHVSEIKSLTGLEADKADILLPGLMILLEIIKATGNKRFHISPHGLLHGMLIQLFRM